MNVNSHICSRRREEADELSDGARRQPASCATAEPLWTAAGRSSATPLSQGQKVYRYIKTFYAQKRCRRCALPPHSKSLAAFTMIEIALALAVIGFALVAIIGVLPAGMSVQKDNRESTLVNFDANFLISAITSGTTGLDDLTNHIVAITNYLTLCNSLGVPTGHPQVIAYTANDTIINGNSLGHSYLTNGANIIALLTTPKYISFGGTPPSYYSNYATADFRAITSSLADQGTSQSAQSFAFTYRIFPEIIPYYAAGAMPWSGGPDAGLVAANFQNNFTQVRLRFRWPVLPNGQVGNSRLTFRTAVGGAVNYMTPFPGVSPSMPPTVTSNALFQPGNFVGQ
jgi:type II secretory pathway pseudopilin PulG